MKKIDVDGIRAAKERAESEARTLRGENAKLRGRLREVQRERDDAQTAHKLAEAILGGVFDRIRRLGKVQTGEARSPTDALQQTTALWEEFERLRKQWTEGT